MRCILMSKNIKIPGLSVSNLGRKKEMILRLQHPGMLFEVGINMDKVIKHDNAEMLYGLLRKVQDEINSRVKNN